MEKLKFVLAGLLAIGAGGYWYFNMNPLKPDLWMVNGLSEDVTVKVGDESFEVGAGNWISQPFSRGEYPVVVSIGDREISSETITIDAARNTAVYNVLGAADVYAEDIPYGRDADANNVWYAGQTFIDVPYFVEYRFVIPPDTVEVATGGETHHWIGVGLYEEPWVYEYAVQRLHQLNRHEDAAALTARVMEALGQAPPAAPPTPGAPGQPPVAPGAPGQAPVVPGAPGQPSGQPPAAPAPPQ